MNHILISTLKPTLIVISTVLASCTDDETAPVRDPANSVEETQTEISSQRFLAGGSDLLWISEDGKNWSAYNTNIANPGSFRDIVDTPALTMFGSQSGNNGVVISTSDLMTFDNHIFQSPVSGFGYGNGTFIVVTNDDIYTTTDGKSFQLADSIPDEITEHTGYDATYGNGVFVTVAWKGQLEHTLLYSTDDGRNWNDAFPGGVLGSGFSVTNVVYSNGIFLTAITNTNGDVAAFASTNGMTWVKYPMPDTSVPASVAFGNGIWIAAGHNGTIWRSLNNGVDWTSTTIAPEHLLDISYGADLFSAVGYAGVTYYSADGASWSLASVPTSRQNPPNIQTISFTQ